MTHDPLGIWTLKLRRDSDPRPRRCQAIRTPNSTVRCEKNAGHEGEHAGRGRRGQWFFWRHDKGVPT